MSQVQEILHSQKEGHIADAMKDVVKALFKHGNNEQWMLGVLHNVKEAVKADIKADKVILNSLQEGFVLRPKPEGLGDILNDNFVKIKP